MWTPKYGYKSSSFGTGPTKYEFNNLDSLIQLKLKTWEFSNVWCKLYVQLSKEWPYNAIDDPRLTVGYLKSMKFERINYRNSWWVYSVFDQSLVVIGSTQWHVVIKARQSGTSPTLLWQDSRDQYSTIRQISLAQVSRLIWGADQNKDSQTLNLTRQPLGSHNGNNYIGATF